jgi:hypothetical protein
MPLLLIALSFGVGVAVSWVFTSGLTKYNKDQVVAEARAAFADELESEFV